MIPGVGSKWVTARDINVSLPESHTRKPPGFLELLFACYINMLPCPLVNRPLSSALSLTLGLVGKG
jgi:hypothetical protein